MNSRQKLHASLALLPVDATQVGYLKNRLLDATPQEVPVIVKFLEPHKDTLLDKVVARCGDTRQRQGNATAADAGSGGVGKVQPGK